MRDKKATRARLSLDRRYKLNARPDTLDFRDLMFVPTLVEVPIERPLAAYRKIGVPILDKGARARVPASVWRPSCTTCCRRGAGSATGFGEPGDALRDGAALRRVAGRGVRRLERARCHEGLAQARGLRVRPLEIGRSWQARQRAHRGPRHRRAHAAARRVLPREPQGHRRDARRARRGRRPLRDCLGARRLGRGRCERPHPVRRDDQAATPSRSSATTRKASGSRTRGAGLGARRLRAHQLRRLARQRHRRVGRAARRAADARGLRGQRPRARPCPPKARSYTCHDLRPHVVSLGNDGKLRSEGLYGTTRGGRRGDLPQRLPAHHPRLEEEAYPALRARRARRRSRRDPARRGPARGACSRRRSIRCASSGRPTSGRRSPTCSRDARGGADPKACSTLPRTSCSTAWTTCWSRSRAC